jgi:peptidoglycan/LPS O-acetylase OafA/YrhL
MRTADGIVVTERNAIDVLSVGGPGAMDLVALAYPLVVIGLSVLTHRYVEVPASALAWNRTAVRRARTHGGGFPASVAQESLR